MSNIVRTRSGGGRRRARGLVQLTAGAAVAAAVLSGAAHAQCAGDCNADEMVAINELIIGVNIASGSTAVTACPSFDRNGNGAVEINELIGAVNNALGTCPPAGDTPTATPTEPDPTATVPTVPTVPTPTTTPTPTVGETVTATPTATGVAGCGDGFVDLENGETCDDGNTVEGDGCPANCRIATCEPSATRVTARVELSTTTPGLFIFSGVIFVRYPDGVVEIPASLGDPPVLERVTSDIFALTLNDRNYGITAVFEDPSFAGYDSGTIMTIEFDLCTGATVPPADAFRCEVTDATDPAFNTVTEQVTCEVVLP